MMDAFGIVIRAKGGEPADAAEEAVA
jgi:hypothetical protein